MEARLTKATTVERVAILETKFDDFAKETFRRFDKLDENIEAASLNGQVPRVKNLAARVGAPDDVEILASVIESRKRRAWLFAPFKSAQSGVLTAAIGVATGAALALLNAWLHSTFPAIP